MQDGEQGHPSKRIPQQYHAFSEVAENSSDRGRARLHQGTALSLPSCGQSVDGNSPEMKKGSHYDRPLHLSLAAVAFLRCLKIRPPTLVTVIRPPNLGRGVPHRGHPPQRYSVCDLIVRHLYNQNSYRKITQLAQMAHLLWWASIYSVNALLNLPFQPLYYFLELQLFPLIRRERLGSKYTVDLF